MVGPASKMSALVVSAIRNLRELRGSTSREIMNYITSQYGTSEPALQRKMYAALKRGLAYGILKKIHGHYTLNTDADILQTAQTLTPVERRGKRRRRRRRRGKKRSRRRRGKRRRRGRGRGRSRKTAVRTRRMGCTNCRCSRRRNAENVLRNYPVEEPRDGDDIDVTIYEKEDERRSQHSKTPARSPTRSRSSGSSEPEIDDDRQAD